MKPRVLRTTLTNCTSHGQKHPQVILTVCKIGRTSGPSARGNDRSLRTQRWRSSLLRHFHCGIEPSTCFQGGTLGQSLGAWPASALLDPLLPGDQLRSLGHGLRARISATWMLRVEICRSIDKCGCRIRELREDYCGKTQERKNFIDPKTVPFGATTYKCLKYICYFSCRHP